MTDIAATLKSIVRSSPDDSDDEPSENAAKLPAYVTSGFAIPSPVTTSEYKGTVTATAARQR
jgi:hypothetical protein